MTHYINNKYLKQFCATYLKDKLYATYLDCNLQLVTLVGI